MSRQSIITLIAIVFFGAIALLAMNYFASHKEEVKPPKTEKELPEVKTEKVSYTHAKVDVEETGRLMSTGRVDLITEVNGRMLDGDIPMFTGQSFKKGDILLRIFNEEAKLSLQAAKSRFLSTIANVLPDLKYDYTDNYENWLAFFNAIKIDSPLPKFPEVKSENEKIYLASKGILNDYFSIQSTEITMTKYTIYAPFDGAFASVSLEVGSIASPGSRVAKMIRTDILELQVPLNMQEVPFVKKGNTVKVEYQGRQTTGKVNRVSSFVDAGSQSVMVYVDLKNSSKFPLYEGMYMKAQFAETELENVMEIPRSALFNFDEVYVVIDGKLAKRRIQIAKTDEYSTYISGLEPGMDLVIESLINASDQMPVKIAQ